MCIFQKLPAQMLLIIPSCSHANKRKIIGVDRVLPSEYEKDVEHIFYLVWTSNETDFPPVKLVPYFIFPPESLQSYIIWNSVLKISVKVRKWHLGLGCLEDASQSTGLCCQGNVFPYIWSGMAKTAWPLSLIYCVCMNVQLSGRFSLTYRNLQIHPSHSQPFILSCHSLS